MCPLITYGGFHLNRGKLTAILTTILFAAVLLSGCIGKIDNTYMYIQYESYYDTSLNIDVIERTFSEANITTEAKYTYTNVLSFSYGRGINNASIESSYGILYPNHDVRQYHAILNIELDGSQYPRPHWTEDYHNIFEKRKPLLNESMNYIIGLIYEATGLTPVYKEFITGDGAQIAK